MGRRGFFAELAHQQRQAERQRQAELRAHEATVRAYERALVAQAKEERRAYQESRAEEIELKNLELDARVGRLQRLLAETLAVDDFIDFESMKVVPELPVFEPGALAVPESPPQFAAPRPPAFLASLFGGQRRFEQRLAEERRLFQEAQRAHERRERSRCDALDLRRRQHESSLAEIAATAESQHQKVHAFRRDFAAGKPEAIAAYFDLVLGSSVYPDDFPRHTKLAYVPDSKELVVEYELPGFDVIPEEAAYRYNKARDQVAASSRPASQRRALYVSVIGQVAIRTLHEIFEADRAHKLDVVVFNGYVAAIDKGTGRPVKPYLITVRTTREIFGVIDLSRIDPEACLKHLSAAVSKSPAELAPVRPVVTFNMVDRRFVEESDVLSTLDQRPNLMELTPSEFESLITNLFERMGLETRMTQASRDGGVDCVAWNTDPILGGKVVIQAKRYKHTVGVSAVRDLFGTMQNEGASKGILVTTSGYGKAAFEFAQNKPIELLNGSNLLYLLEKHGGMCARIEAPADWRDPVPDVEQAE